LQVCHGVPHGSGGIRSLLRKKYPDIIGVVVPRRLCLVGNTVPEGGTLLALAFLILLHRLLA
jgi:hypothetical protein